MSRAEAPPEIRESTERSVGIRPLVAGGMFGLGVGYFITYTPYTGLAKATSEGRLPGMSGPATGLQILPPSALGLFSAMVVFLLASGWWRHARDRQVGRLRVPFPGRETAASAFFMALIVGTTTLNFTFTGISILFVLVLERLETLVLAPSIDVLRRRKIHIYSWTALGLCGVAAVVTLADVNNYRLTIAAAASIVTYLAGYWGRFNVMSRHAKTGSVKDRRYFVEEHMTTPIMLLLILGTIALLGHGSAVEALRQGFTTFLFTPAGGWAFLIGVCYEALFIFTTHIFLDRREFAFGMPVHVCASLLAGVAATFILRAVYGTAAPSPAQFVAATCVIGAAVVLSYPALRAWRMSPAERAGRPLLLFVCGGNTCRSAMAEAIARTALSGDRWQVASAGLNAVPGTPMEGRARTALAGLGVSVDGHRARQLTREMIEEARAIFCMTQAQCDAVIELVPEAASKTQRLDPNGDIPDPHGRQEPVYREVAERLRYAINQRLAQAASVGI